MELNFPIVHFLILVHLKVVYSEVQRTYMLTMNDTELNNPVATFSNISRIRCCTLCGRDASCHYVSYHNQSKSCQLTSGSDAEFSRVTSPGWTVFQDIDCPKSDGEFVTVHSMSVAFCHIKIPHEDAIAQCARVGANLVKPDTATKYHALRDYILSQPLGSHYKTLQTDGRRHGDGTWKFSDGSLVPTDATLFHGGAIPDGGGGDCLKMVKGTDFFWADRSCANKRSYICEKTLV